MRIALIVGAMLLSTAALAQDKPVSAQEGTIDTNNVKPCASNKECVPAKQEFGGLPYVCFSDVHRCGWVSANSYNVQDKGK